MSIEYLDIIEIIIIYQVVVYLITIFLSKKAKPFFTKVLMSIFITILLHFFYMILVSNGFIDFAYLGPFFGFLYGPFYYIYTKSLVVKTTPAKKLAYHFIPAFVFLPVAYLLSDYFNDLIGQIGLVVSLYLVYYLIKSLLLIRTYKKHLYNTRSDFYKISLYWLRNIIFLQLFILIITLVESYYQTQGNTNFIISLIFVFVLILIHCFYYLGMRQVQLFSGFKEEEMEPSGTGEYSISEDVFNENLTLLKSYFREHKPYLEFEISLQELSEKTSITTRNLSHIINREYKMNYYHFINHHRLKCAKRALIQTDKPVKEIMYDSGFSNKATFNSAFKADTGLTPLEFRKKNKV